MAAKIRVLSDHTINQIAAGEVIENPSSVVKELVENSIDAGATEICVEIQGGGRQLIRITDNGCGMNRDDALLCLERHATSKLKDVEDIHTITTMGFRGEAIPSIASISKFTLLTCPAESIETSKDCGTMILVDGGRVISCSPAACSPGTTIEVKSLFFNVPVRKKFLRSPAVDANEIHKTVSLIALGYPHLKFHFIRDGKTVLSTQNTHAKSFKECLKLRIEDILGHEIVENTVYIEETNQGITLEGYIGTPSYTRHNKTGQYLYINKRAVTSPLVSYAVKDGLGTSIDNGRFPVFVFNLSLDGSLVDVNVHPQKREVRLRQEQIIRELIITAVRKGISRSIPQRGVSTPTQAVSPVFERAFSSPMPPTSSSSFSPPPLPWEFTPAPLPSHEERFKPAQNEPEQSPLPWSSHSQKQVKSTSTFPQQQQFSHASFTFSDNQQQAPKVIATIPGYILIDGSLPNTFLERSCQNNIKGRLYFIDQRSAHSRITFERLSHQAQGTPIAQQTLLIPHHLEVSPFEATRLRMALPVLQKLGVIIDEFGPTSFVINALPQMLGNISIDVLVSEIMQCTSTDVYIEDTLVLKEYTKRIAAAASRAAVSSAKKLAEAEAQTLVDQLVRCESPYYCPNGKPTVALLTEDLLIRLFVK